MIYRLMSIEKVKYHMDYVERFLYKPGTDTYDHTRRALLVSCTLTSLSVELLSLKYISLRNDNHDTSH